MIFNMLHNDFTKFSKLIKRLLLLSTSLNENLTLDYYKSYVIYLQKISDFKAAYFTNLTLLKIL